MSWLRVDYTMQIRIGSEELQAALPPISRSELARLRRGELDANAFAALVERTVGLAVPAAPAEGDLLPNQSRAGRMLALHGLSMSETI